MKRGTVLQKAVLFYFSAERSGDHLQQQIKQKRWHAAEKWIWLFLPIGLLMGVLLGRHLIFDFVQLYFPPCVFYTVTHFYCPGCGNTRTVLALLHGHPLQALHNNAAFCYLLVVLLLLYLQKVLRCFGKPVQLLPKGNWFPIVSVCICMAYCLIRNFIPWMQPLPV